MKLCAMVPATGMPCAWPAATFEVDAHAGDVRGSGRRQPRVGAVRHAAGRSRRPTGRPPLSTTRAALEATAWRVGRGSPRQPRLDEASGSGHRRALQRLSQRLVRDRGVPWIGTIHGLGALKQAEPAQVFQELWRESLQGCQIGDVRGVPESQALQVVEGGVQAAGDEKVHDSAAAGARRASNVAGPCMPCSR